MMSRSLPSLVCAGVLLVPAVDTHAQQPAPGFDPAAVLATLKKLKTDQPEMLNREKASTLANITAAINDPAKAYEQAVNAVEIQGNGPNEGGRIADWRKRNGAQLRDRDFQEAVRLHLTYLALTWQHSMGVKVRDQIPALLNYTSQVANDGETILAIEAMKKPVTQGLFANYFQVGPFLKHSDDWEEQPFEVDGIYRRTILPQMRADKDPRLLDYWNARIQAETARANSTQNGLALSKARNVRLPGLAWSRAEDEVALGQVNQGVADMMAIVKAHPDHPEFDRWVNKLTEVVTPPAGEVTVKPATAP